MANIKETTMEAVECGAKFHVDFRNKSLKINGKYVIKNGEYDGELELPKHTEEEAIEHYLSVIEDKFYNYQHSRPTERSQSRQRSYFVALNEEELSADDMMFGMSRDMAQFELEFYILQLIMGGFEWKEEMGKWFWRSKVYPELILFRTWFN